MYIEGTEQMVSVIIVQKWPSHRVSSLLAFISFKRFYLFIFREEGREGEREGEKHQCVVASRVSSTVDLACKPGMCPDWESNQ